MKIVVYCQHTLGIGHYFRTLEICRALEGHQVFLLTGGPSVTASLPEHVHEVRLPALKMDTRFKGLYSAAGDVPVEQIKTARKKQLYELFEKEHPGLFIVELYPFGRKKFRFELDPVLEAIEKRTLPSCRVVCSLRDILVEKDGGDGYEERVIHTVNRYFDAVWVHADPVMVRLDQTFPRLGDIRVPFIYTGFVTPEPPLHARREIRGKLQLAETDRLIVVSAGGGKVGGALLTAVARAFDALPGKMNPFMIIFTGPFADDGIVAGLRGLAGERLRIHRFTDDFPAYLAAADLSVSMAGYNTCMNVLAAHVPALVLPFDENREQRMRAEKLARMGYLHILEKEALTPRQLVSAMITAMAQPPNRNHGLNLDGAARTARLVRVMADEAAGG